MQIRRRRWKSFPCAEPYHLTTKIKTLPGLPRSDTRTENRTRSTCEVYTHSIYLMPEEVNVSKAKVFKSGNSQAVRLPKQFRFQVDEVEILRRGNEIVLKEPRRNLIQAFTALGAM